MSLRDDDRAVTVQIGAVLLLGFLVVSLSLYQATVVPNENRQVEFQHNQRVQADMQEVRNAILGTASSGSAAPVGVELGTQYPSRAVAVNPGPPSGTLSTAELGTVRISNARADDQATADPDYPETADFWDGEDHTYPTKSLVYRPDYANYDAAPTTVYENGVVYNRFDSGNLTRTGQPIVAGTRISLVALDGNLSRGGASTLSLDPQAVSVSTRTISVSNVSAGENVSIFVPSRLNAQTWTDLLNETGEYDPAADPDNDARVYRVENVESDGRDGVELYFEPGTTYQLKLSKIGVGSGVDDTDPAYLTSIEDLEENPFEGRTYPFVVESRDKYNNPVPTTVGAGSEETTVPDGVVLEPGRYRYQYTAPDSSTASSDSIGVSYRAESDDGPYDVSSPNFEGERVENVEYDVNVQAGGGSGGGNNGGGTTTPGGDDAFGSVVQQSFRGGPDRGYVKFTVTNQESSSLTIESIEVTSNGANRIYESQGGSSEGNTEFFLSSGGSDAIYESGDSGSFYSLGDTQQLDSSITVNAGSDLSVTLSQFRNGNSIANMENDEVSVTFYYSDTSADPTTVTFQVQP
ncbi:hypothetical protein [Halobellus rarus]|uniref:Uncharacterized protein n=1 Tax=Halobellus rarus TaxID=1126237 RepID=A0ABD6CN87_9EURY|nr:hypothetical protein [Halobellus rarus]